MSKRPKAPSASEPPWGPDHPMWPFTGVPTPSQYDESLRRLGTTLPMLSGPRRMTIGELKRSYRDRARPPASPPASDDDEE